MFLLDYEGISPPCSVFFQLQNILNLAESSGQYLNNSVLPQHQDQSLQHLHQVPTQMCDSLYHPSPSFIDECPGWSMWIMPYAYHSADVLEVQWILSWSATAALASVQRIYLLVFQKAVSQEKTREGFGHQKNEADQF